MIARLPRETACQLPSVIPLGGLQNIPAVASLETSCSIAGHGSSVSTQDCWMGLTTGWDCRRGFGYQELFPFNFPTLDHHPARCEIKLSSKGVDSVHRCTVGVQPPCRAGLSFALLCDECTALCLQQPTTLKWKHLMFITAMRKQTTVSIPKPRVRQCMCYWKFSVMLSLADRNILRNISSWAPCAAVTEPILSMC